MDLSTQLLKMALVGAEWVLWLLIGLSLVSVAIIVERALFYFGQRGNLRQLTEEVCELVGRGSTDVARERLERERHLAARIVAAGLKAVARGPGAVEQSLAAAKADARLLLERNLAVLGTLGSNAPFIGLFGTVIGIIKAFHDLATSQGKGPSAVMASLSEALVATAVGLLVAIPAVISYNYFQRRVRTVLMATDAMGHAVLSELHREGPGRAS